MKKRFILLIFLLMIITGCAVKPTQPEYHQSIDTAMTYSPSLLTATPTSTPLPTPERIDVKQQHLTLSLSFGEFTGEYTGQLIDGLPEGSGIFTADIENGTGWTYNGEWNNGHFNGSGTVTWNDGFATSGIFQSDSLCGEGSESIDDVTLYQGSFEAGYYHGFGTLFNIHGEIIYSGTFRYGRILESAEQHSIRFEAFKDECKSVKIRKLRRTCKNVKNLHIVVCGRILDIRYDNVENPTYCDFLMYEQGVVSTKRIIRVVYTLSEGEVVPFEEQVVSVWGTTENLYTYTTTDNKTLSVPQVRAVCVK